MTSYKVHKMNFVTLQTETTENFEVNLKNLKRILKEVPKNSLVLAPELCLTGYAYNRLDEAVNFSIQAIETLKAQSSEQTIGLTLTTKEQNHYYNTFFLFKEGKIVHQQRKAQLFKVNHEHKFFSQGESSDIQIFELDGIKVGVLICFELRFIELWLQLKGADVILVPAMWGNRRKENFETLTQALAIANQCFVLASDCANDDCAKGSGIITPFGETTRDDNSEMIVCSADLSQLEEMRKNLFVGIKV